MMRPVVRFATLLLVAVLAAVIYYLSRFWDHAFWTRPGLFGWEALPPQGGLVGRWLRGTDAAPFELLIWAVGGFLVLTLAQKLYDRITTRPRARDVEEG